jgi:hypothetical protein
MKRLSVRRIKYLLSPKIMAYKLFPKLTKKIKDDGVNEFLCKIGETYKHDTKYHKILTCVTENGWCYEIKIKVI